jgi:adenosine deaminase
MARRSLAALPKAELHLHLEGSMRRETLISLCHKHKIAVPEDTRGKKFDDFTAFANVYIAACECLREEADLRRLVLEVAEDAAASGARWIEPALSMLSFCAERFGGEEETLRLLIGAAEAAEKATGVGMGFIVAAERNFPPADAERLAGIVRKCAADDSMKINGRQGIIGFGLHGKEEGFPPSPFTKAFSVACEGTGVSSLPHAGEIAPHPGQGSKSVSDANRLLKAKRIGHGVLAADDDEVLQELINDETCLDICLTSNYLLQVVSSVSCHPLSKLCEKGVACTINSDDSLLFGCDLVTEFALCRNELGMADEDLAKCAKDSFRYSCAPNEVIAKGLLAIDEWLST